MTTAALQAAADAASGRLRLAGSSPRAARTTPSIGAVAGSTQISFSVALATADSTVDAPPSTHAQAAGSSIPPPAGFRIAAPCGSYFGEVFDTTLPDFGNGYPSNPPWPVCGYAPGQFRSAYGLPGPDNGAGARVAIVDAYASPTLYDDAAHFAALNGPKGTILIDARIVASTGAFAGSTGQVAYDGADNALTGSGTYAGQWTGPQPHGSRGALKARPHHHTPDTTLRPPGGQHETPDTNRSAAAVDLPAPRCAVRAAHDWR